MRLALSLVLLHVNAAPLASDGFAATTGRPPASELPRGVARAPIKSEAKSTAKDYNCTGLAVETGPLRRPFRLWMHGEPGLVNAGRAATYDVVLCIEIARERTARPQNTFWTTSRKFLSKRAPANASVLSKRPVGMRTGSTAASRVATVCRDGAADPRPKGCDSSTRQVLGGLAPPAPEVPAAAPGELDPESLTTKMMISISRSHNSNNEALDEKLALPMLHGAALPLYMGTGHRIAQDEGYPVHAILDRAEFKSDDDVAKAAAKLAKDPAGLDKRQKEVLAYEWKFGSTSGRHYVACRNFSFATKQVQVKVKNDHKQPVFLEQLYFLFGGRYDFVYGARGDVIIDQCCWGNFP